MRLSPAFQPCRKSSNYREFDTGLSAKIAKVEQHASFIAAEIYPNPELETDTQNSY